MSSTSYDWRGYGGNSLPNYSRNNQEYIDSLTGAQQERYYNDNRVQSAYYNPKTQWIHVTGDNVADGVITREMWNEWPRVLNHGEYKRLKTLSASGQKNLDQVAFDFIAPEFQDQANRCYQKYKTHGAAVITSNEFPQITVSTVSQGLLNRQTLVAQKYNLLGFPEKITVSDTVNIIFPEYNNTNPSSVRVGYKENEAIDTAGYGQFTQTNVTLKKAGAGLAFTEEYYMRNFTVDIQSLLLEKIALDFTAARYNRIISKLASGTTTLAGNDWAAYTAGNLQSTNRPLNDLTNARLAINSADKLATANLVISNSKQYLDFISNTWVRGPFSQDSAAADINGIVTAVAGVPWITQWILNEDMTADTAYVLDSRSIIDIEGPRKTQQINTYNPDQTVLIQKEWFDIIKPTSRAGWIRQLTGI